MKTSFQALTLRIGQTRLERHAKDPLLAFLRDVRAVANMDCAGRDEHIVNVAQPSSDRER